MKNRIFKFITNQKVLILFIYISLFLIFSLLISFGYINRINDDLIFYKLVHEQDSIFDFLVTRYLTWSSRIIIESFIAIFSIVPLIAFRLFFSLLLSLTSFYYCLIQNDLSIKHIITVNLLFLSFPLFYLSDTGFISTGLNYPFPFLGLLMCLLPLVYSLRNKPINRWYWILGLLGAIVASNFEITALLLFAFSLIINIKLFLNKQKYYFGINVISFIGILFSLLCPGNSIRTQYEIEQNFPIFSSWNILDKSINGLFHGLLASFTNTDTKFYIIIMLIMIMIKYYNTRKRILLPLTTLILVLTSSILDQLLPAFFKQDFNSLYNGTTADIFYLFILFITFVLCSISIIYAFDNIRIGAIYLLVFIAGACSFFIIGFSPTIIASGYRVFNFMIFAIIFCISGIIKETTIVSKKQLVMLLPVILIYSRMIISNINYITSLRG